MLDPNSTVVSPSPRKITRESPDRFQLAPQIIHQEHETQKSPIKKRRNQKLSPCKGREFFDPIVEIDIIESR